MKRNEIKNKKLMSALTIGLSAMMALSTPITAYASGTQDGEGAGDPTPPEPQTQSEAPQQTPAETESVTAPAVEQAEVAQQATVSDEGAQPAATEAAQNILEGNEAEGIESVASDNAGTLVNESIETLVQAATEVVQNTTDENGAVTDKCAATSLENAGDTINEAKTDLNNAGEDDQKADAAQESIAEQSKEAMENLNHASQLSNDMVQDTKEAEEKADSLVKVINEATTEEEANKAYKELEENVSSTETTLAAKKAYYDRLMENYNKALAELSKAEKALEHYEEAYSKNLDAALEKAKSAEQDIVKAQEKVDNLAKALDDTKEQITEEAECADKAAAGFEQVRSDWGKQDILLASTIENYIIPQVEGKKITDFKCKKVVGFDKQEYNYFIVTYKENGAGVTRYFNYDRVNRAYNADRYASLGSTWGISLFEKSKEEVEADRFLIDQYKGQNISGDDLKKKANSGELDVFTYTDQVGKKVMLTRAMLNEQIAAGDIIVSENGMSTKDGYDLKEIVQNSNSLLHDGNAYLIAHEHDLTNPKFNTAIMNALKRNHTQEEAEQIFEKMTVDTHDYHVFIGHAEDSSNVYEGGEIQRELAAKYEKYESAVQKAQNAVDKAEEETRNLAEAIDELKSTKKNRKVLAIDALGVDDVATYFGINATAEEADKLNQMTVREVIDKLNDMLEESGKSVEKASENLKTLKDNFEKAKSDLDSALLRLNPVRPVTIGATDGVAGAASEASAVNAAAAVRSSAANVANVATVAAPAETAQQEADETVVDQRRAARQASENAQMMGAAEGASEQDIQGDGAVIEDDQVALAETLEGIEEASEDKLSETAEIADEETAKGLLEQAPVKEENMSFWWLLLIALLGEAGREMYVKHKKKQEEKAKIED